MFLCSTLLEEVVPAHVFDKGYGKSTIVAIAFIIMVQEIFVLGLFPTLKTNSNPNLNDYQPFKDSNQWMFLICIPMVLNFYLIFALIFIHPYDSIDYNIK